MNKIKLENNTIIKISIMVLITALIMGISSIMIYSDISKPKFYDNFINLGNKYLLEGKYEEAILAFDKAIIIDPKSTEALLGSANGYIGKNDIDTAIDKLKQAQNIDLENENLLIEILEILKDIDQDIAYDILQNYIDKVGMGNISNKIQEIVNISNESPIEPISNPKPDTYINPIKIKLELDKLKVGHTYYYTLDGSKPDRSSEKYRGDIEIEKSTTINLIGYNRNNESTEVITLEYIIDTIMVAKIEKFIDEAQHLVDKTIVGTKVGNCVEGSKEPLIKNLNITKDFLKQPIATYDSSVKIYNKMTESIDEFKANIIENTDKSQLKTTIEKAQNIYNNAKEGNKEGEFKVGSKKKLLNSINEGNSILNDILSKQNDIDNMVYKLKKDITIFENNKIISFSKGKALQYLKNIYGEELTHDDTGGTGYIGYIMDDENMHIENGIRYYKIVMFYFAMKDTNNQLNKTHQLTCGCSHGICQLECYFNVYENGEIKLINKEYDI